jgi:DNA-binding NtrC family response regulator
MTQVLLVDDDDDSLSLLAMVLSRRGLQVHTARSVQEARARLEQHPCDVVVTDIELGDGD